MLDRNRYVGKTLGSIPWGGGRLEETLNQSSERVTCFFVALFGVTPEKQDQDQIPRAGSEH
jgi:hypothetical protein